ncbi:unnamed protein product [Microthlaspi erraticum]|uniref:Uncharacterized protein n=1 Tax=Microthlaspi erraticum TaxID=1685480 RepID=A0A6D2K0R3_9BRAS|nr:unnamed protein product [Microthlaspi erraticum]
MRYTLSRSSVCEIVPLVKFGSIRTSGLRLPSQNGQVGSGKEFPWPCEFGSFLFVSSCIKVLVKLKEEFSNRLARLCRDLVLSAILLARHRPEWAPSSIS